MLAIEVNSFFVRYIPLWYTGNGRTFFNKLVYVVQIWDVTFGILLFQSALYTKKAKVTSSLFYYMIRKKT
jgi:hypothetical protein